MSTVVWLDALTSKQGTMLGFIAKELEKAGFNTLVTCREYEYTVGSLKRLGIDPVIVGRYSEGDPYDKVLADAERILKLIYIVKEKHPAVLVAYPNPSAARLAYGVGIPYVGITDSPHAEVPSRLSLPLASVILCSRAIDPDDIRRYMFRGGGGAKLIQYEAVDELFWILRSKPNVSYIKSLGLDPGKYVVLRPHEEKATYYRGLKVGVDVIKLALTLKKEGYVIVLLPRYRNHLKLIRELDSLGVRPRIIQGGYDGVSLTYYAAAVITGGASIAREAALLLTPGLTYYPGRLAINEYVRSKGYPLFNVTTNDEVLEIVGKYVKSPKPPYESVVSKLTKDFEDPMKKLLQTITEITGYTK